MTTSITPRALLLAGIATTLVACGSGEHKVTSQAPPPPPPPKSIQEHYAPVTDKAKATEGAVLDQADRQKKDIDAQAQ